MEESIQSIMSNKINDNDIRFGTNVTRVEVIDNKGRSYTKLGVKEIYGQLQDGGKTLKLFVQYDEEEEISDD